MPYAKSEAVAPGVVSTGLSSSARFALDVASSYLCFCWSRGLSCVGVVRSAALGIAFVASRRVITAGDEEAPTHFRDRCSDLRKAPPALGPLRLTVGSYGGVALPPQQSQST